MKKSLNILAMLLISIGGFSQDLNTSFVGKFTDGIGNITITELHLKENGTFYLKTADPIFPYTFQFFENEGVWISKNDSVFLNPDLCERTIEIGVTETEGCSNDSISIKINYFVDYFQSDTLLKRDKKEIELMTICFNTQKRYVNLVRYPQRRGCLFAPKIKNQIIIDSTNTFKIKRKELDKIGIFTYGFEDIKWMKISNKNSNYFEIEIIQQVDIERTPRNRKIIVKGNRAYFYKKNGKIDKSLTFLMRKQ